MSKADSKWNLEINSAFITFASCSMLKRAIGSKQEEIKKKIIAVN